MSKKIDCAASCEMRSIIRFETQKICAQVKFLEKNSAVFNSLIDLSSVSSWCKKCHEGRAKIPDEGKM